MRTFLIAAVVASSLAQSPTALADGKDRIVLRQESGATIGISGRIVEYTGKTIEIELSIGQEKRSYDVREVDKIEYKRSPSHEAGRASLQAHRWKDALRWLSLALEEEPRRFVRREILAEQTLCETQLSNYGSAAAKFLTILESDPDSLYFKYIPLIWTPHQLSEEETILGLQWVEYATPATKLIGASFLIHDPQQAEVAQRALQKLSTHPDSRIMGLAAAQLWKFHLQSGKPTEEALQALSAEIEKTPVALRAGPYYTLGRGYLKRDDYERAAQAFLWPPLVFDANPQLAARSCLEAAHALKSAGQTEQAETLFREVATKYDYTSFASEARAELPPTTAP